MAAPSQTYEKNLKPTLDTILTNQNLDLVILSHIDNDHVLGLLDLLKQSKGRGNPAVAKCLKLVVYGITHSLI